MTVLIDALESGHEAQDVVPRALPHRLAASLLPVCSVGPAARTESSSFRTRTLRQPHRCILRHGCHRLGRGTARLHTDREHAAGHSKAVARIDRGAYGRCLASATFVSLSARTGTGAETEPRLGKLMWGQPPSAVWSSQSSTGFDSAGQRDIRAFGPK